jgi:hypothetical protein
VRKPKRANAKPVVRGVEIKIEHKPLPCQMPQELAERRPERTPESPRREPKTRNASVRVTPRPLAPSEQGPTETSPEGPGRRGMPSDRPERTEEEASDVPVAGWAGHEGDEPPIEVEE